MVKNNLKEKKIEFITNELWILAWNASVQRANLFKKDKHPISRVGSNFRKDVIKFIVNDIIPRYVNGCAEEQHYKNIDELIAYANKVDPGILGESGYKYGVAQKLLNLALKYYWCQDLVMEPPHCPIDRIVIGKTKYKNEINWTQIKEMSQYQKIIKEIKVLSHKQCQSIPLWELENFDRK